MKKIVKKIISVLLALLLLSTSVVCAFATSGDAVSATTMEKSKKIAEQMEDEGLVLLKNDNSLLPLADKKVSVFGIASCCLSLSGGGSGSVNGDNAINFYEGLSNAGIEYNTEVFDIYSSWKQENTKNSTGIDAVDMLLGYILSDDISELPIDRLDSNVMRNAQQFSDTAIFVIGRAGAELSDLTAEQMKLTADEEKLLDKLTGTFDNIIVVFNTSNTMEMGWLDNYPQIKAAIMLWLPGEVGTNSLGRVLSGEVNPSGKLVDTIAYDVSSNPTTVNFGNFSYSDALFKYFVNYQEGIYVGYRYYETFAKEAVQYPFGYGLSYTDFDWETVNFSANSNEISVTVKVTNTGSVAGKDTVEVYFSAPYYFGGIEKSSIELAGYAKTGTLNPGQSENVIVTFDTDDMASYDYQNTEAWVLESGDYQIKVGHSIRDFEDVFTYNVPTTKVIKNDDVTGTVIENLFDDANGGLTYLSRTDSAATYPTSPKNYNAPEEVLNCDTRPEPTTEGTAPKTGVTYEDGTIMLADVKNDPSLWDKFLDQLTIDEMIVMIAESGYQTAGVDRLGIPRTVDNDGPASVKGDGGLLYKNSGLAYPVETVLACTWNDALAQEYGKQIGLEAKDIGTNIWYAPACNIHRSPMGGRNFEYFSEDPLISGKMAAAVTKGAQSQNLVVTVKHFACNDQETNRMNNGLFTWLNEQSMRELYLEPFEIAVKEGNAKGIMSAYNRIGSTWCSASEPLLVDLLREEWGFNGYVVCDAYVNFTGSGYMDPVLAIYARNDALLTSLWYFAERLQITQSIKSAYEKDPVGLGVRMRECCKDLCEVKMFTLAFDPSTASGNKGNVVLNSQENTTNDTNGSGGGSTDGTSGNTTVKDANIAQTGNHNVVSMAAIGLIAATAAVVAPIAYKKSRKTKKEK